MTLGQLLRNARERLADSGVEDASVEAEVLLRHQFRLSKTELYLRFDSQSSSQDEADLHALLNRRILGEPTAYITGHREFFGLDFLVDRRVLIPRPESELLVERAIILGRGRAKTFADVGTGSGCIAASIAHALPRATVIAVDLSSSALEVARANCERLGVDDRVSLLEGDLLEPITNPVDVIVANPPYVRREEIPSVNTRGFEPEMALDGGEDGLDVVRRISRQAVPKLNPGGSILLELGLGQAQEASSMFQQACSNATLQVVKDLAGIERMLVVTLNIGEVM